MSERADRHKYNHGLGRTHTYNKGFPQTPLTNPATLEGATDSDAHSPALPDRLIDRREVSTNTMPRALVLMLVLLPLAAAGHSRAYSYGFLAPTSMLRPSTIMRRPHPLPLPSAVRSIQSTSGLPSLAQPPAATPQHKRKLVMPLLRRRGGSFHLEPAVVKASLTAVAELLISCGIGAFATRKGVLDRTVISSLSKYVRPDSIGSMDCAPSPVTNGLNTQCLHT